MPEEAPRWMRRFADNREVRNWNLTSLLLTLPLLVIGYFYYGGQALRVAAIAVLAAVITELIAGRLILRKNTLDDCNAVVVGLWIACMLPAGMQSLNNAPLYAAAGAVFAILVVKLPFGGTMHVPFSPAAAGFAFLTVCFPGRIFSYLPSEIAPPVDSKSLASLLRAGQTVLRSKQTVSILLGQTIGPMGTGCILLLAVILLCTLLLKSRRTAAFSSIGFLISVSVLAFLFPRVTGVQELGFFASIPLRLEGVGMELCAGSLLFAAIFLLPDPAILPGRWFTRLGYGGIAGAFCLLLRSIGSYEESVCFAILLANAVLPLLYRIQAELHHQKEFREQRAEAKEAQ